jgi:hypothetical protein
MEHALEPTADPAWVLDAQGYDPLREGAASNRGSRSATVSSA